MSVIFLLTAASSLFESLLRILVLLLATLLENGLPRSRFHVGGLCNQTVSLTHHSFSFELALDRPPFCKMFFLSDVGSSSFYFHNFSVLSVVLSPLF